MFLRVLWISDGVGLAVEWTWPTTDTAVRQITGPILRVFHLSKLVETN
jgi:hypothetical protein